LACMPLELKLRGKSTAMSHRSAIYYVDLVVRSGMTLEQAVTEARRLHEQRVQAGFDQAALDEAARQGFANGAFEELAEDVPEVVEEFFSQEGTAGSREKPPTESPVSLSGRLAEKVARINNGRWFPT